MDQTQWTLIAISSGIVLAGFLVWRLQEYRSSPDYQSHTDRFHTLLKIEEKWVLKITRWFNNAIKLTWVRPIDPLLVGEILVIGIWAFWVGKPYLNFDPLTIPGGREFNSAIQSHHLWTRLKECGRCAFWNSSAPGGYPAFAEAYGSMLHPLVMISTLSLGVLNGAKITLVLSLWTAGIAQWWIARELDLGRIPRLWSGFLAVVGGHLTGRMELGLFGIILSTAMASLVIGGVLALVNRPGKKNALLLGVTAALALVAGQGYIQLGLAATIPAFVFLVLDEKLKIKSIWKYFALALGIAVFLSAYFLIPFAHFSPNFAKYWDPEFNLAQPIRFLPLNYVIDNLDFYRTDALLKQPFPSLYTLFIGWVPIALAVFGLTNDQKLSPSLKAYFTGSILIILLFASGDILRLLAEQWHPLSGFRHSTLIAGITVPLILGLSAAGLDKILRLDWPKVKLMFSEKTGLETRMVSTHWLLLIPLVFNLSRTYQFSKIWIRNQPLNPEILQVDQALMTESLQWVEPPFGEHLYIEPAVRMGMKLSPGIIPWHWKDRELPTARLEASHAGQPADTTGIVRSINDILIYERSEEEYAAVIHENSSTPCQAAGLGGEIEVTCHTDQPGKLVIKENFWTGWKGWRDGKRIHLESSQWITTQAPSGKHHYQFQYRPWDVPLGLAVTAAGVVLCLGIGQIPLEATLEEQSN